MQPTRLVALLSTTLLVAACSGGTSTAPSEAASAAPTEAASAAPSQAAGEMPADCTADKLATLTAGTLTIGTDNPAYPPYFEPPASGEPTKPWELGDPTNGQGFESAFAYALANRLGFAKEKVVWVFVPFDTSYAPGTKTFDLDVNQVSYTPERATAVDLSDGYYYVAQAIVANAETPITGAKSIADLKAYKLGAMLGTTSASVIRDLIQPTATGLVYQTNDAAIQGLNAKQIDGIVVDLPTAFYMTAAQMENGVIVGQFPVAEGPDAEHFSAVLQKGSSLTSCVNAAIGSLKADGTLGKITQEWLADKANAPVFAK